MDIASLLHVWDAVDQDKAYWGWYAKEDGKNEESKSDQDYWHGCNAYLYGAICNLNLIDIRQNKIRFFQKQRWGFNFIWAYCIGDYFCHKSLYVNIFLASFHFFLKLPLKSENFKNQQRY